MTTSLTQLGSAVGALLKERKHTIAVSESSAGGLINAALVAVPGASAYYLGGGVIYTVTGREALLRIGRQEVAGMRSASEPYAALLAKTVRAKPAPAARAAIVTATRQATPASRSAARWRP